MYVVTEPKVPKPYHFQIGSVNGEMSEGCLKGTEV